MEQSRKLYSQKAIAIATFFGGPAAAGYLVKKNYEAYNQDTNGKKAFAIGCLATLAVFSLSLILPDYIPNLLIPAIYMFIIYQLVEKVQGQWLREHEESGGEFYSGWKATGIGSLFLVILFVFICGAVLIEEDLSQPDFDTVKYDNEIAQFGKNEELALALAIYENLETKEVEYILQELEKSNSLWNENKAIINGLDSLENLPTELLEYNKKLVEYCDIRLEYNTTTMIAISLGSDNLDSEYERLNKKLNSIMLALEL